jgi:hypothetical protein
MLSPDFSSPDHAFSFWQHLIDGGPLYILFQFLFVAWVFVALFTIFRRLPLPWMLFASCMPYIWGSAAAHIGVLEQVIGLTLDSSTPVAVQAARFSYDIVAFNWACIISLLLMAISLLARPKAKSA